MPHSGASLETPAQLSKLLQAGLERSPDAPALISLEDSWTWAELEQATDRLAAHYLTLGLQPGDRVASLMPNRSALFIHYIACFKAGLAATPLNYRYTPPEIDHALTVSGAKIILAHAERAADIAASKASSLPLGVITYGDANAKGTRFEELLKAEAPSVALPELKPEMPAADGDDHAARLAAPSYPRA
jgi:long-chain acyl-CoA synthetase